jgi:lactate racemase
MLQSTHNIEATLEKLKKKYGNNMKVAVLPLGPLTIPYVRGE